MFTINNTFFKEHIEDACFIFGYENLSINDNSFTVALRVKEPTEYYTIEVTCNYKKLFKDYCSDKKIDLDSLDSLTLNESEAIELFYMHIAIHLRSILVEKLYRFIDEMEQEIKNCNDPIEIESLKECIHDYNYSLDYISELRA